MHSKKIALIAAACALAVAAPSREFSGVRALEYTRKAAAFGPRPAGSPALARLRSYIVAELKAHRCEVALDEFSAATPNGPKEMKNILARFRGKSGRAIAVTGHYETKYFPGQHFVGANDAGSSAGFLLEMAAVLAGQPREDDIYLVWFDGEEAFGQWSATDSLYGSRHLAEKWASDGTLGRLKALINVDMIGDKNLGILEEMNSTAWLRRLVWDTADRLGYGRYFLRDGGATEDDHIPFLRRGASALDLIDFDYPPWHTPDDTVDKLSAHSFEVVGNVLTEVIRKLEDMR
jgi:Zn-dependent M28 family amino/carboxypeptidase